MLSVILILRQVISVIFTSSLKMVSNPKTIEAKVN